MNKVSIVKNKNFEQFLSDIEQMLKPLNTPKDLIKLGLERSEKTMANKRSAGSGADFVKLPNGRVVYPKEPYLDHLRKKSIYVKGVVA